METVYIGLGGNLEQPVRQLIAARRSLADLPETEVAGCSSLYRSAPVDGPPQPDFINAVCALRTNLSPKRLLNCLWDIEQRHGRQRDGQRNGPRTLDLDILLFGERMIDSHDLTVPHPRMHERAFVILPLMELAGDPLIPGRGRLRDIAERLEAQRIVIMEPGSGWDTRVEGEIN